MNKLFEKGAKLKKEQWIVIVICGILLILLAVPFPITTSTNNTTESVVVPNETIQIAEDESLIYVENLEAKLQTILSTMDAVGQVEVFITLATSQETVVEKDISTVRDSTTETDAEGGMREVTTVDISYDTVYSDSGKEPYITKIIQPEIAGVMIVAQGADSGSVNKNITEAIQALFGLEAHKIKVVKMKTS